MDEILALEPVLKVTLTKPSKSRNPELVVTKNTDFDIPEVASEV
jgi:hypothetical protein